MQNNTLTLLIPGLLTERFHELRATLSLPNLSYLLSRADKQPFANGSNDFCGAMLEYQLSAAIGLNKPFPYAALAALGDGLARSNEYWLYASPVHFTAGMHDISVAKPHQLHLHREEVDDIVNELNAFLATDGLRLHASQLHHWYLKIEREAPSEYPPFWSLVGSSLSKEMIAGESSGYWQRLAVELQLLLSQSVVNKRRGAANQLPISSLWFWGGGMLPQIASFDYDAVIAQNPLAEGVAILAEMPYIELPARGFDKLQELPVGNYLAVIDTLQLPWFDEDIEKWLWHVKQLETQWFSPIIRALKQGSLHKVILQLGNEQCFIISKSQLRRWWRRIKSLDKF